MKTLRHLLLALLFLGLTALEIGHGIFRLNTVRESRHRELLAGLEREHNDLARSARLRLEEEREHAAYLSRLPAVRTLLRARDASVEPREDLQSYLLPYLVSFRGIDRVRILNNLGEERFRCERMGKGVGALPEGLLRQEADPAILDLAQSTAPGEVVLSDLRVDRTRVEVSESDRQVVHYVTSVHEGDENLGFLVLTVYASPLLNEIRRFAPLPEVHSYLVARDGSYLASTDRSRERGSPLETNLRDDYPSAAQQILSGAERIDTESALFLSLPTGGVAPPWRLVSCVPYAALDAASGDLRGEYAWVIGSVVLTTVILVFAGAFLIRMSVREFRLREAARYERQQKQMERQMQMAERLGSLGLLTAGVAHEINNPLEGIENYLALLEREPISTEKRQRYVEMVRYGFRRIRNIVRDLSSFARPGVSDTTANLGEVVEHALRMVGYTKDFKGIDVQRVGFETSVIVTGDPGRLEQVFINLLLNAARAMKGEGEIQISAKRLPVGNDASADVEIALQDTGPGIPEEFLDKIFDPFFTMSDGTGLGLSISYGIIHAHGGTITAQNGETRGAKFTIRLPMAEPAVVSRGAERTDA